MYVDKLDDIVSECNKIFHSTIKMKPADANLCIYIDFGLESNDKNPKFKVGDQHSRLA